MKTVLLSHWQNGKVVRLRIDHYRAQMQVRRGGVERARICQCPDRQGMLGGGHEVRTDKKLSAVICQEWAAPGRRISGKNRELKAGREWQGEAHDGRKRAAASIDQGLLGDSEDGCVDEAIEAPIGVDGEFVDADIKPVVIHGKVGEIRDSRTALIGIMRKSSIQNINQIVPCGVISLADRKI